MNLNHEIILGKKEFIELVNSMKTKIGELYPQPPAKTLGFVLFFLADDLMKEVLEYSLEQRLSFYIQSMEQREERH